jgi:cytochrome P450
LLTGNLVIVFIGYTDVWRRMRKAVHEGFNKAAVHRYHPIQYAEAVHLVQGVLATPEEWDKHLRRSSASSVMAVVYGTEPIASEQDPRVKRVNDHVTRLSRASLPGAHLVQFIPWMRYLPRSLAKWKRNAQDWHERDSVMFGDLLKSVRQRMAKGEAHATLAATLVEDVGRNNLSEKENAWLAGTMYAAGAETTSSAMAWFMFAIVLHPDVQKRAQAELDTVVGRSRPPSFSDFEDLPYIRALVKEVLRWHTVDPVGLPHRTTEDDWYNGYFIPKGTLLVPNVWHLNRDPDIYGPDADLFNPSRHLDRDGQLLAAIADTKDESHVSYGFGRRICIGRHVANNALFINISMMLWAMNIERATDEKGELLPMDVDGCIEDGLVVRPLPFQCKISPRFPEARDIIAQERESLHHK